PASPIGLATSANCTVDRCPSISPTSRAMLECSSCLAIPPQTGRKRQIMIGSKLGPYDLIEEIGHGGMASVYRAYQPSMDRFVAVKVIHKSISLNATALERFTREARLIARLEHPHILPVYDYNGQSDPPYIVMRYLPSGTLKDIISREKLAFTDAIF